MNRAVFLDRDGVINELVYNEEQGIVDSPFKPAQMRVFSWVPQALSLLHAAGYLLVITSNQPGMAKGYCTEESFNQLTQAMHAQLDGRGNLLAGEYYCFHHPQGKLEKYRALCQCRKPAPGMLLQAARDLDIDLKRSWMLGDGLTDIEAGTKAGCMTILICSLKCELCSMMKAKNIYPHAAAADLLEAADIVLKET